MANRRRKISTNEVYDQMRKILDEAYRRGVSDTLVNTWRYRRIIKYDTSPADTDIQITPKKGWKYFSRLAREGRLGVLPLI